MNPRRFLALALRLVQSDKSPEGCRTAVSRAYYAAYHSAAAFLEQCGVIASPGPSAHGEVRHRLGFSKDSELERLD